MEATFEQDGSLYTLTVERTLAHPPEKVWRVLTDRALLRQWFPCDVEGDWRVGAELTFTFLHGEGEGLPEEYLRGEVLVVDEPRQLAFRWGTHVLEMEVEPVGDGSRFRLSERLDDPSWAARNAAGWELCIENLDLLLEGAGLAKFAAEVWRARFQRYVEKFEPDFGPQSAPDDHPLLDDEGAA